MKNAHWKATKFTALVRISEENLRYLRGNKKGRESIAGMLDEIINNFRKNNEKKERKT